MILSTSNEKSEIEFCLGNGADHYFVKPSTFDGLEDIVKALCKGKLTIAKA
jgi:DNA-binding NarL/FixJ family response regulator